MHPNGFGGYYGNSSDGNEAVKDRKTLQAPEVQELVVSLSNATKRPGGLGGPPGITKWNLGLWD